MTNWGIKQVTHDPMEISLGTPSIPEQTHRHEQTGRHHDGDPELGLADAVVALLETPVQHVVQRRGDLRAQEEAYAHGYEIQAPDARAHVVLPCPQSGKRR